MFDTVREKWYSMKCAICKDKKCYEGKNCTNIKKEAKERCGIDKTDFKLDKAHDNVKLEAMCNPIGQAVILNKKKTDLNIILGLCIGHDILFTKYSQAPVTTLAVKDRVLAHNPLGAIYSRYYYNKIWRDIGKK